MGYPPLVTPTSQIVGIQAVMNVLFGRYERVTAESQGVAYGLYGKTRPPWTRRCRKKILKGYERGEEPITVRPGRSWSPNGTKPWPRPRVWPRTKATP